MSEYKELFEKKYKKEFTEYRDKMNYGFMLDAPEQYGVEDKMLDYLKKNPNINVLGLLDYFDEIVPDGLAPNDDGLDLLEED